MHGRNFVTESDSFGMTNSNEDPRPRVPSRDALSVLEMFSAAAGIAFDRILAARALGESERAIPGDDWQTWSRRLVEVGESLSLRIRSIETNLDDALTFVRQGTPVATTVAANDGELRWVLVAEARGRKARIVKADDTRADTWISIRRLRKLLGLSKESSYCRWVIGQAALACDPPRISADSHQTAKHLDPLFRLIGLLRPEKKDLWVILVFSIVVGVLALASPVAVEALVNTVAFGRYLQPVIVLAILLFTFLAFAAAMRALITLLAEIVQRRLFVRVVEDLAYRLPRVRQQAFDEEYGPELVNRFFDVVTVQKAIAALLLDGISIVLQTIIGMAVLAFYHPFLLGFDIALSTAHCLCDLRFGAGSHQDGGERVQSEICRGRVARGAYEASHSFQAQCGQSIRTGSRGSTRRQLARSPPSALPCLDAADRVRLGASGLGGDRSAGPWRLARYHG